MTHDRRSGTQPEPAQTAGSGLSPAPKPRLKTFLIAALILGMVLTGAGAALNSTTFALSGALLAAVTVVAYDKTQ